MTPRSFRLAFAMFPYGGNGGISSEVPFVRHWVTRIIPWMLKDQRIEAYFFKDFSDTPIPMTRNKAVLWARSIGADFLIMTDSDMWPDRYLNTGDGDVKPFLESSFDYAYERWDKEMLCIFAPYCGAPPEEPPFVFEWKTYMGEQKDDLLKLEMMSREQAARLGGFHRVAAGPTGLMMTDMRLFEIGDPKKVKEILQVDELKNPGWFYYEYTDDYGSEKASTEDVTFTRELSQVGLTSLGYNPVVCNFDAWAAHMKPKAVGKPQLLMADAVNERLVAAVKRETKSGHKERIIDYTDGLHLPENIEVVEFDPNTEEPKADRKVIAADTAIRSLYGCRVTSIGFCTNMEDLSAIAHAFNSAIEEHKVKSVVPMRAVEIGSWVGESAVAMAACAMQAGNPKFSLWCIDPHQPFDDQTTFDLYGEIGGDRVRKLFDENTAGIEQIRLWSETSVEAARMWSPGRKIDFIFFDGAHSAAALSEDLTVWGPHLTKRATLVFHDYKSVGFPGVTEVIHRVFGEENVIHPAGTQVAIVRMADIHNKRKRTMGKGKGGSGPAKAESPPKGGPAQKNSPPKGGPAKGKGK